jgi:hypothetical protein
MTTESRRGSPGAVIGLALLGVLAVWLYRPWYGRPFDVIDFADFLPPLSSGGSFGERVGALVDYYGAEHGRFNLLAYVGLAAKWELFGSSPLPWQLIRAAQMLLASGATYLLLRRLAASPWGATLGASVILFSFSASHAWVRLPVPEPLGLLCVLAAVLVAVRVRTAGRWRAAAIASGACIALAILTKEMLVGWVPIIAYLGCFLGADGRLEPIRAPDSRGRWLLLSLTVGTVAASIPVLVTASGSARQGYTSMFGLGGIDPLRAAEIFQRMLLPWPVAQGNEGPVFSLPALAFLIALVVGLRTATADAEWGAHARRALVLGLALPAIGTALYLPWPTYWAPYGLPFIVGLSVLVAIAVTAAERRSPRLGLGVRLVTALGIVLTVAPPVHLVRRLAARQDVNVALARALLSRTGADSVIVALAVPPQSGIPGIGSALRKYALVLDSGARLPPALDAHCPQVSERLRRGLGRTVLISYGDQCGPLPVATLAARRAFRYFDLARLRIVTDTIQAQLLDPMDLPRAPR